jgi:hypothetical protein
MLYPLVNTPKSVKTVQSVKKNFGSRDQQQRDRWILPCRALTIDHLRLHSSGEKMDRLLSNYRQHLNRIWVAAISMMLIRHLIMMR